MPYLKDKDKPSHSFEIATTPGELNFLITELCTAYIAASAGKYQHYNDVVGALESAKLEFYRRAVVPYETKKIAENGDVY